MLNQKLFVLLLIVFGENSDENAESGIPSVKIEEDECVKKQRSSHFIGVHWSKTFSKWTVHRGSKTRGKMICVEWFNVDQEIQAAHASDNLARELMQRGEKGHKLNFCKKEVETSSKYLGVSWSKKDSKWLVSRRSKPQGKMVCAGRFNFNEELKAAFASDTLARDLAKKGEKGHKLNFPNSDSDVWKEKKETSSKYIGVCWDKTYSKWKVSRSSKTQGKNVYNGQFNAGQEKKAAHASDTLARDLMKKGEVGHELNFPSDTTDVWPEKETPSKYCGVIWHKSKSKWMVCRWSKVQRKMVYNGCFNADMEIKAAHASDTLARELMNNGEASEQKLNFPNVWSQRPNTKKRTDLNNTDY